MSEDKTLAWWWAPNDNALGHGDGRPVAIGTTHEIDGEIKFCKRGLHGSSTILAALGVAPGSRLYLTEISGELQRDHVYGKVCGRQRRYLLGGDDVAPVLRQFVNHCAQLVEQWWAPVPEMREAALGDDPELRARWRANMLVADGMALSLPDIQRAARTVWGRALTDFDKPYNTGRPRVVAIASLAYQDALMVIGMAEVSKFDPAGLLTDEQTGIVNMMIENARGGMESWLRIHTCPAGVDIKQWSIFAPMED